jgi:hypothetical protein
LFEYIWNNCNDDGLWTGDAETVAAEFHVSEDEAYSALRELSDHNRIQRVGIEKYIITRWRERDESRATWLDL